MPPRDRSQASTAAGSMPCGSNGALPSRGLPARPAGTRMLPGSVHPARVGRHGVDQHQRVHAGQQVVGQVHAPDAVVDHLHARAGRSAEAAARPPRDLRAEAVIAQEHVADAGHRGTSRSHSAAVSPAAVRGWFLAFTSGASSGSAGCPGSTAPRRRRAPRASAASTTGGQPCLSALMIWALPSVRVPGWSAGRAGSSGSSSSGAK